MAPKMGILLIRGTHVKNPLLSKFYSLKCKKKKILFQVDKNSRLSRRNRDDTRSISIKLSKNIGDTIPDTIKVSSDDTITITNKISVSSRIVMHYVLPKSSAYAIRSSSIFNWSFMYRMNNNGPNSIESCNTVSTLRYTHIGINWLIFSI